LGEAVQDARAWSQLEPNRANSPSLFVRERLAVLSFRPATCHFAKRPKPKAKVPYPFPPAGLSSTSMLVVAACSNNFLLSAPPSSTFFCALFGLCPLLHSQPLRRLLSARTIVTLLQFSYPSKFLSSQLISLHSTVKVWKISTPVPASKAQSYSQPNLRELERPLLVLLASGHSFSSVDDYRLHIIPYLYTAALQSPLSALV